jgi:hypothetical protein
MRTYLMVFPLACSLCQLAWAGSNNSPGIVEPCLSATSGVETRIPQTDQATGGALNNIVGAVVEVDASGATSLSARHADCGR